ncbi:MAG: methylmalonyl-CoA mutase family protein [Saprospiraceae bacterium]
MDKKESLSTIFPPISKEKWIANVEKELKGKALEELSWQLEADILISPFFHPDVDKPSSPLTLYDARQQNEWEIGQQIAVNQAHVANQQTLEALKGGVNAPLFAWEAPISAEAFHILFKGVNPTYISTHFSWHGNGIDPRALLSQYQNFLAGQEIPRQQVSGSLAYDPLEAGQPLTTLVDLIQKNTFPRFKYCQIDGSVNDKDPGHTSSALAQMISRGNAYLDQLQTAGIPPTRTNQCLQFLLGVGNSFFVEIAKLRALRLLWMNVLAAYDVAAEMPPIVVHTLPPSSAVGPYQHMIQSATQAMSAVIGGANRLYVLPADSLQNLSDHRFSDNPDFGARIARNVQHLLQEESFLGRVIDPAAGSYYVEVLTEQLAQKAWRLFQEAV